MPRYSYETYVKPLRRLLLSQNLDIYLSSYDNIPDGLFNTPKASDNTATQNMQRTTIISALGKHRPTTIFTTDLLRWRHEDRKDLFTSLRFVETTALASETQIPRLGNEDLVAFWRSLKHSDTTIADIATEILSETRKPDPGCLYLTVPRIVGYFISATFGSMERSGVLSIIFDDLDRANLVRVLLNSNIFYWYTRCFGDGFHLTVDLVGSFPVPDTLDNGYKSLAENLDAAVGGCRTFKVYRGKSVPSFNFNHRMDVLLEIDHWMVQMVDPETKLKSGVFAKYKSSSSIADLMIPGEDLGVLEGAKA